MCDNRISMEQSVRSRQPLHRDVAVARLLRERRVSLGLTLSQVADRIGVALQQMQKYEVGANRMSIGRFVQICEALNIAPTEVLDAEMPSVAPSRGEVTLMRLAHCLTVEQRTALADFLRKIVGSEPPEPES